MKTEDNSIKGLLEAQSDTISQVQDEMNALIETLTPLRQPVPTEAANPRETDVGYEIGTAIVSRTNEIEDIAERLRILRSELSI